MVIKNRRHWLTRLASSLVDVPCRKLSHVNFRDRFIKHGSRDCEIILFEELENQAKAGRHCIILVEFSQPLLLNVTAADLSRIQILAQRATAVIWVASGGRDLLLNPPSLNMATGLMRTLQSEMVDKRFATVALQEQTSPKRVVEHVAGVYAATIESELGKNELDYQEINGNLHVNRIVEANFLNSEVSTKTKLQDARLELLDTFMGPLGLTMKSVGVMDSFEFVDEGPFESPLARNDVEVVVEASGLGFRDLLIASGLYDDTKIGLEFAGTVADAGPATDLENGDRVFGWAHGSMKTIIRCDASVIERIPKGLSFVKAAAIPVAYCTAYHSLATAARIRQGDSILIHSGAGGTGQAAIQLAQHFNANIYVTVGNEEKKTFLQETYGIPSDHIFSSRTPSFKDGIRKLTNGRGVDILLNSLRDEVMQASLECLSPFGRFIDLGRKTYANIPMSHLSRNISFIVVDLLQILKQDSNLMSSIMKVTMKLFKQCIFSVREPVKTFGVSNLSEAFRYMQSGKGIGRVVIEIRRAEKAMVRNFQS